MAADLLTAISKSLTAYLAGAMPSLKEAREDWPSPSEPLDMPCLTVVMGKPTYQHLNPFVVYRGTPPTDPDETNRKVEVRRVVGQYEMKLQIDIWCAYKPQRRTLWEEFHAAIDKDIDIDRPGLDLALTDYFDSFAHFHIEGFQFPDKEEESERKEWRVLVTLVCTANHILSKLENLVEAIENTSKTDDSAVTSDNIPADAPGESQPAI